MKNVLILIFANIYKLHKDIQKSIKMSYFDMEKQIIIAIDNAILVVDFTDNTITGDTFTVRNVLKGWGLKWDSDNSVWTGNRNKLKELCYCYKLK